MKETHPDQGGSAEEFKLIRDAYKNIKLEHQNYRNVKHKDTLRNPQQKESRVECLNYEELDKWELDLEDDDLFERVSPEDFDSSDWGRVLVQPNEFLLEAAENRGFTWPYACRGGACTNCAVAVVEGELSMPANHILSSRMIERGIRLSCVGTPITKDIKVVYNIKHLPGLDKLRLPSRPFE